MKACARHLLVSSSIAVLAACTRSQVPASTDTLAQDTADSSTSREHIRLDARLQADARDPLQWAASFGGAKDDLSTDAEARAVGTDRSGRVYVLGRFEGAATFGSQVHQSRSSDIFLASLDGSGSFRWVVTAGGTGSDIPHGLAVDAEGNSYIMGDSSSDFQVGGIAVPGAASFGFFVTKLAPDGSVAWTRVSSKGVFGVALGPLPAGAGATVLAWVFTSASSVTFAGKTVALPPSGGLSNALYLAKLSATGSLGWSKAAPVKGYITPFAMAVDSSGQSVVTGWVGGTASVDGHKMTAQGENDDAFVIQVAPNGDIASAVVIGTAPDDGAGAIAIDSDNVGLLAGGSCGSVVFDICQDGRLFFARGMAGSWSSFTTVWKPGVIFPRGLAIDTQGRVAFAGHMMNAAFVNGTLVANPVGEERAFVARIDRNGNPIFGQSPVPGKITGWIESHAEAVAASTLGSTLVVGSFFGAATFGSTRLVAGEGRRHAFVWSTQLP